MNPFEAKELKGQCLCLHSVESQPYWKMCLGPMNVFSELLPYHFETTDVNVCRLWLNAGSRPCGEHEELESTAWKCCLETVRLSSFIGLKIGFLRNNRVGRFFSQLQRQSYISSC